MKLASDLPNWSSVVSKVATSCVDVRTIASIILTVFGIIIMLKTTPRPHSLTDQRTHACMVLYIDVQYQLQVIRGGSSTEQHILAGIPAMPGRAQILGSGIYTRIRRL